MARRRSSFIDTLLMLPWQVALSAGALGFGGILLSLVLLPDAVTSRFAPTAKLIAWSWLLICLIGGAVSAWRSRGLGALLERRRNLEEIRNLPWQRFELIVREAFRRLGYDIADNGDEGGDDRVDLVVSRAGRKFFVRCRQWQMTKVGATAIRELAEIIKASEVSGGFFVSAGTYTREARKLADEAEIALIDGEALENLVESVRPVPAYKNISSQAITIVATTDPAPLCPTCNGPMILRTAQRGVNEGRDFWACENYPQCRGMRAKAA